MEKADQYKGKIDIGVICIREDEYTEFLRCLSKTKVIDGDGERRYRVSTLKCEDNNTYLIAVTRCLEQGNIESEKTASDFIKDLDPKWILVVGIAGGVPDNSFSLGDIVVSSRVYDLTLEASNAGRTREYSIKGGNLHPAARRIAQDIPGLVLFELKNWHETINMDRPSIKIESIQDYVIGDNEWRKKIIDSLTNNFSQSRPSKVISASIASSDRLIKDPEITQSWKRVARHFLAIEMELAGVCRVAEDRPTLGIRGISDIVGYKRDEIWTSYACKTAAIFAMSLIKSGLLLKKDDSQIFQSDVSKSVIIEYDIPRIRQILTRDFSDAQFLAFCQDNFPEIYDDFGSGMTKGEKITHFLDMCRSDEVKQKVVNLLSTRHNL